MAIECSIVIPLCDEAETLPALHLRLSVVMRRLAIPYEIIYVDDGSRDATAEIIRELHHDDHAVKALFLSRNFGHQAALCAGLEAATGRAIVSIDGDLQDPPEVIPDLIEQWRAGYQIVFARRRRRREGVLKRSTYFMFYRLLRQLSSIRIPLDTGDFALMDRQAVNELNSLPERTRFIRGLRSWVGFRQAEVTYERELRYSGHSKYSFRRLLRLALDGMFGFSDAPLKMISAVGGLVLILGLSGLFLSVFNVGTFGGSGLGWLGSGLVLLGGVQLIALGVIGEYLARVYQEVRGRPLYVTRERLGFESMPRPVPRVLEFLPTEPSETPGRLTAARLDEEWPGSTATQETGTEFP